MPDVTATDETRFQRALLQTTCQQDLSQLVPCPQLPYPPCLLIGVIPSRSSYPPLRVKQVLEEIEDAAEELEDLGQEWNTADEGASCGWALGGTVNDGASGTELFLNTIEQNVLLDSLVYLLLLAVRILPSHITMPVACFSGSFMVK